LKFDTSTLIEAEQLRNFIWDIEDSINNLKRKITETAFNWSMMLNDIETIKKKEERKHVHNSTLKSFQSTPEFFPHDYNNITIGRNLSNTDLQLPVPCGVSILLEPSSFTDASFDTSSVGESAHFLLGPESENALAPDDYSASVSGTNNAELAGSLPKPNHTGNIRHSMTSAVLISMDEMKDSSKIDGGVERCEGRSVSRPKSMAGSGNQAVNIVPYPL
jgi:hypothetical protein